MTYLLILPICLYVALAAALLLRAPRSLSSGALALPALNVALITFAYLMMGTTGDLAVAEAGAALIVVASSWLYLLCLPLVPVGVYFETWARVHLRMLAWWAFGVVVVLSAGLIAYIAGSDAVLVIPAGSGYWIQNFWNEWDFGTAASNELMGILWAVASQIPLLILTGAALGSRRVGVWRGALLFMIPSLLTVALPALSWLAPLESRALVAALGYAAPVLVLIGLAWRASRQMSLATLKASLDQRSEGVIVVDSQGHVVWKNAPVMQWQVAGEPEAAAATNVLELLRGSPLQDTVKRVLANGVTSADCEFTLHNESYVVNVQREPLADLRDLPGAQMLVFRNITASRGRRDLDDVSRELLALSAISVDISSSLEMDQVIARALQQVLAVTKLDDAVIYLLEDDEPTVLHLAGSLVTSPHGSAPLVMPLDASTAGDVVKSKQTVVTPNADEHPIRGSRLKAQGLSAGATVPLIARNRVIGVLQVASHQPHNFDRVEVALLESVGRQLAIAIDNARLHHEERWHRRVAETLREVSGIMSSNLLEDGLSAMLNQLKELVDYDRATVLLHAEPGQLRLHAYHGLKNPADDRLRHNRIVIKNFPYLQKLFDERAPQYVPDTWADPNWIVREQEIRSWLGVPLIMRDKVWGCLSLSHVKANAFSAKTIQIVQTFADQVVVALENMELFENEQRRRMQAEFLQQTSYDLVTSPDLDGALSAALDRLSQVIAFDRAHIGLIDPGDQTWTPRVSRPPQTALPSDQAVMMDHYPLVAQVIREKRAKLIPDTRQHELWRPGRSSDQEVRCWIGAPLVVRERVIGILNLDGYRPYSFSEEQFQLVQTFANQIAAAVENFRLLEEASRQNRALSAMNTILAASSEALTHENLPAVLLQRVLETLNLPGGTIHQRDETGSDLRLRAAAGLPDAVLAQLQRIPAGSPLSTITLPPDTMYSFFSVPLVSHGTEIGLLSLLEGDRPFSSDLCQLLFNIGQQLGVVIDNAVLFENTVRRGALSTDLGRLSLAISAQLDRSTVLNLICRESMAVFNAQAAFIWLIEGSQLVGTAAAGTAVPWFIGYRYDLHQMNLLPVRVVHEWRARYVNHIAATDALTPDFLLISQAQAALAIPLLKADTPVGTLLLVNTDNPDAFAEWQAEQSGMLGVQAALALQNTALFDEIRRRLDQLRLVNEVGRYATAILTLQSLVEGIAGKLFEILQYTLIGLWQVEEDHLSTPSIFAQNGASVPAADRAALQAIAEQAVRLAEPILQNRQQAVEEGQPARYSCAVAVPLIVADEVVGVLIAERQHQDSIRKEDLDVLEPLAAQLAISVSNARLFEKVRRQTVELEARVAERTAEIRRQHERTEAMLRSVADAVIVYDLGGQLIMTNPVAKELFDQYDLDMNLGPRINAMVERVLSGEADSPDATETIELGPVVLQAKAARVVESGTVLGTVVVLRDISRLHEVDRMKDAFVANVSHELRTPLANLKLYLSLLQQGRPERRANHIEVMDREIDRLTRLINELLALSRLQSEQHHTRTQVRQLVDVDRLIQTVVADNIAQAESKRQTLRYERLSPLPAILADPDQIVRAVTNLVSNAINYTPEEGQITVRSYVEESIEQINAQWVMIEVTDTGIGIPPHELPKLFTRFFRASNVGTKTPGTGLGLAIIKEIVELHGGTIHVESVMDQGSTFRLRLPVPPQVQ